jgi:hypothetical protein
LTNVLSVGNRLSQVSSPVKVCGQTSVKWATMTGEIVFTSHT